MTPRAVGLAKLGHEKIDDRKKSVVPSDDLHDPSCILFSKDSLLGKMSRVSTVSGLQVQSLELRVGQSDCGWVQIMVGDSLFVVRMAAHGVYLLEGEKDGRMKRT